MTDEVEADVFKQLHEMEFEKSAKDAEKRLEFADSYAHAGLKSLVLVNGASIISLLTLIGTGDADFDTRGVFWSFAWFASGLGFALVSHFCAYLCQNFYMLYSANSSFNAKFAAMGIQHKIDVSKNVRIGHIWLGLAILSAILSMVLFVLGAFVALVAIT